MEDISGKILSKIKADHIAPAPKWHFKLKNYVLWLFFGFSIIVGGITFAVIFHMVANHDWDIYWQLRNSVTGLVIAKLPYIWLFLLIFITLLAYFDYVHTKRGYRVRASFVFAGSILFSLLLGSGFYFLNLGYSVDKSLNSMIPAYESMGERYQEIWNQPEMGLITGTVIEEKDDIEMVIEDRNGEKWNVNTASVTKKNVKGEEKIEPKKRKINVVGKKEGEKTFVAKEIRPCKCPNKDCGREDDDEEGEGEDD